MSEAIGEWRMSCLDAAICTQIYQKLFGGLGDETCEQMDEVLERREVGPDRCFTEFFIRRPDGSMRVERCAEGPVTSHAKA